jgi:hypothetical protein
MATVDTSGIEQIVETERTRYSRFNKRLMTFFQLIAFSHLALILVHAALGVSIWFTTANLAIYVIAQLILLFERDAILCFVATHVAWLFSYSAYVYSTLSGRPVDANLYGPDQSISIILIYHLGCTCAYGLYKLTKRRSVPLPGPEAYYEFQGMISRRSIFILLGFAPAFLDVLVRSSWSSSLARQVSALIWLGIGLRYVLRKNLGLDLYIAGICFAFFVVASMQGARSLLLAPIISFACIYIYQRDEMKALRPRNLIIALVAINALSVISEVTLDLRLNLSTESRANFIGQFAQRITEPGNLESFVNPFHKSISSERIKDYVTAEVGKDRFQTPYYASINTLASRLVSLPMLDVVCGIYPTGSPIKFNEIKNILLSLLPDIGQEKDLIYSDRLTWDMGLRDFGNVGRPEVTNACELFTIAGWSGMFAITFLEFLAFYLLLDILKRQLKFPILWVSVLPQIVIWVTITSTALSIAAYITRIVPLTIFCVWAARALMNRKAGGVPGLQRRRVLPSRIGSE